MSSAAHQIPEDNHDDSHEQQRRRLNVFTGSVDGRESAGPEIDEVHMSNNTVRGPWPDQDPTEEGNVVDQGVQQHDAPTNEIDSLSAFEEAAARALGHSGKTS